jgi:pSer/pThr/pTyr-binding forkhead associated (FHA) protein
MWTLRSAANTESDTQTDAGVAETLTFRLPEGAVKTLGRAAQSDFILDAALVSRVHCRLMATMLGELHVEDLSSTNGTFVNDRRIDKAVLSTGDRLRIGRVELAVTKES